MQLLLYLTIYYGTYTISMIDSLGCESFDNIEVEEINNLDSA